MEKAALARARCIDLPEEDHFVGVYKGEKKDGKPDGLGVKRWLSGASYEGEWRNGQYHGLGVLQWSDGSYEGEWKDDKRHGIGVLRYSNGSSYAGEWIEDIPL